MPGNVTTVTTTVNTGTTSLFTVTQHTTVQAAPVLIFGLPPWLLGLFGIVVAAIVFLFFRFQVKGIPVQLLWIYKNGSAVMVRAKEDMQGIFLDVIKGNKAVETLKKTGLALPVKVLPNNFKAYIETPQQEKEAEDAVQQLRNKGFTVTKDSEETRGFFRKKVWRGYLVEKKAELEGVLAHLDVSLGGLKSARLYATVEGAGETMDWKEKIDAAPTDSGNTILLKEMQSAAKGFFALLAEAMQGSIKTFLIPLLAGAGLGGVAVFMVVILTGHLH